MIDTSSKSNRRETAQKWYLKNKSLTIARAKAWKLSNPEKAKESSKRSRENNPERRREAVRKCKLKYKEKYRISNLVRLSKRNSFLRKNDPRFKVREACRSRLGKCISAFKKFGAVKFARTEALLGCSFKELVTHLESKFKPGMTWKNHAKDGWHIDHIKPICEFDILTEKGQCECFHYTNLQPLWWYENLAKRFASKET